MAVAPAPPGLRRRIEEDGYVVVPGVVPASQLDNALIADIFAQAPPKSVGTRPVRPASTRVHGHRWGPVARGRGGPVGAPGKVGVRGYYYPGHFLILGTSTGSAARCVYVHRSKTHLVGVMTTSSLPPPPPHTANAKGSDMCTGDCGTRPCDAGEPWPPRGQRPAAEWRPTYRGTVRRAPVGLLCWYRGADAVMSAPARPRGDAAPAHPRARGGRGAAGHWGAARAQARGPPASALAPSHIPGSLRPRRSRARVPVRVARGARRRSKGRGGSASRRRRASTGCTGFGSWRCPG